MRKVLLRLPLLWLRSRRRRRRLLLCRTPHPVRCSRPSAPVGCGSIHRVVIMELRSPAFRPARIRCLSAHHSRRIVATTPRGPGAPLLLRRRPLRRGVLRGHLCQRRPLLHLLRLPLRLLRLMLMLLLLMMLIAMLLLMCVL